MSAISRLQRRLKDHDQTPEGLEDSLTLQLSEILVKALKSKGWTQRRLADAARIPESNLTAYIHGDENPTFRTVSRLFTALGLRGQLTAFVGNRESLTTAEATTGSKAMDILFEDSTDGKENDKHWTKDKILQSASTFATVDESVGSLGTARMDRYDEGVLPKGPADRRVDLRGGLPGRRSLVGGGKVLHHGGSR